MIKKWVSLKLFLTDLRTFDIMYNKDIFKEELFRYFRILTEMFSSVSHKRLNKRSLIKRDNRSCRQPRVNTKISFDLVDEVRNIMPRNLLQRGINAKAIISYYFMNPFYKDEPCC